ncbi:MAG: cupredoxin domain-containing protein [Actinobacteria bacterium]|nr:cupredoxin domain-containing protein [Actinomycetota bacterium]
MSKLGKGSVFVVGTVAALTVAVTGAFGGPASATATTIAVTTGKPSEFKLTLSKKTIAKGVTTFKVVNKGAISHDFKIAGKRTPILKTGKTATVRVTFSKAGKFPYLCTLPGHAAAGMKGVLVVK